MAKGRPTADFDITADVTDGVLTIIATAAVEDGVDDGFFRTSASGTVALGKEVAELGKIATPVTNAERKHAENVTMLIAMGLSEEAAEEAASKLK